MSVGFVNHDNHLMLEMNAKRHANQVLWGPYSILEEPTARPFSWRYVSAFTKNSFVITLDIKRLQLSWFVVALPFNLKFFNFPPLFSFKNCYWLVSKLLSSSFFQLCNKSRFQCPLQFPAENPLKEIALDTIILSHLSLSSPNTLH